MDPIANFNEQVDVANQIADIIDDSDFDGNLTPAQRDKLEELANYLSYLVLALAEWKLNKGGF